MVITIYILHAPYIVPSARNVLRLHNIRFHWAINSHSYCRLLLIYVSDAISSDLSRRRPKYLLKRPSVIMIFCFSLRRDVIIRVTQYIPHTLNDI